MKNLRALLSNLSADDINGGESVEVGVDNCLTLYDPGPGSLCTEKKGVKFQDTKKC